MTHSQLSKVFTALVRNSRPMKFGERLVLLSDWAQDTGVKFEFDSELFYLRVKSRAFPIAQIPQ